MRTVTDPERQVLLRQGMKESGLDAVLAWYPEDLVMMAGTWPCLGMNCILYPRGGDPVYYLSAVEPEDVCPDGFIPRRFDIEVGSWKNLHSVLAQDIAKKGIGSIGIVSDGGQHGVTSFPGESPIFGTSAMNLILDGLPVRDATPLFVAWGLHKTVAELERIRRANTVAGIGLSTFHREAQAGRSETEIAALVEAAIQSHSGQDGCSLARGWAHVQAGPNIYDAGTFSRSSAYRLKTGDLALIELGTCVDGYWSDLTRTVPVGNISSQQRDLLLAVKQAQKAAIATLRPGCTHEAVDRAARDYLEAQGMGKGFKHGVGHHVGFKYHDRGPGLSAGSTAPLETGMVVTIEPGCYGEAFGGGARFEDNFVVSGQSAQALSPQHLVWEP